MFLRFEENPNTGFADDRVYQERSEPRVVSHVLRLLKGQDLWCPVVGLEAAGLPIPALARKVEDSGEGMCYLVYGSLWGLRLKTPDCVHSWSLEEEHQWGEPFLLLPADGADLRFS